MTNKTGQMTERERDAALAVLCNKLAERLNGGVPLSEYDDKLIEKIAELNRKRVIPESEKK